jgi:hypothetical protein
MGCFLIADPFFVGTGLPVDHETKTNFFVLKHGDTTPVSGRKTNGRQAKEMKVPHKG